MPLLLPLFMRRCPRLRRLCLPAALALAAWPAAAIPDPAPTPVSSSGQSAAAGPAAPRQTAAADSPVAEALARRPWNWGAFFAGGRSAGVSPTSTYWNVGGRLGRVLTGPSGPGLLRGRFEYSAELMPWWQARTASFDRYTLTRIAPSGDVLVTGPYRTGGAYNGISVTPIILRWDLETHTRRILPFLQGAGGLVWTNHKYPPVGPYPAAGHQGTSVFNFTPQFGVGLQYFVSPGHSITFNANAVHISNASLGDANPGVNATVQFQIGYSWWK